MHERTLPLKQFVIIISYWISSEGRCSYQITNLHKSVGPRERQGLTGCQQQPITSHSHIVSAIFYFYHYLITWWSPQAGESIKLALQVMGGMCWWMGPRVVAVSNFITMETDNGGASGQIVPSMAFPTHLAVEVCNTDRQMNKVQDTRPPLPSLLPAPSVKSHSVADLQGWLSLATTMKWKLLRKSKLLDSSQNHLFFQL